MAIRMQQRRGTSEQWTLANPVLATGEIGWESDNNKFKIGDGVNTWDDLSYFVSVDDLEVNIDDFVPLDTVGEPDGVASLDATGNVPLTQLGNVPAVDLTGYATETYVGTQITNLIDAAPSALNTLNELAAALGDDASFATTVTNSLANKQDKVTGVSDTEIGYLDGVTSAIQTQLNGKAASSHTHPQSDITNLTTDLAAKAPTANPTFTGTVVLPSTTSIGDVSSTELGYVNGVTSAIQTQLDGKQATLPSQTSNSGKFLSTNGTAVSWQTVPGTTMSDTAPASPAVGDRWVKTTTWQEYIYFDGYWVEI